jgi:hypothetical protein
MASVFANMLLIPQESRVTSFTMAFDAFTLVQVGFSSNDQRLIHHASKLYSTAVHGLREELVRAMASDTYSDTLVATPYLLFLCERFTCIAVDGRHGSLMHLKGFAQLLLARSRESKTSMLQYLLLDDYQHYALEYGLVHRQQVTCSLEDADIVALANTPDRMPRLTVLTMEIPTLLEKCDRLRLTILQNLASQPIEVHHQVLRFFSELAKLEKKLRIWQSDYYLGMNDPPYTTVPITTVPDQVSNLDRLSLILFENTFWFPSFGTAISHLRLWSCLLLLRTFEFGLRVVMPQSMKEKIWELCQAGTAYADRVCKVIMYLHGTPNNGTYGAIACCGPLQIVEFWYKIVGEQDKVSWCEALRLAIRAKGLYVPDPDSGPLAEVIS